MTPRSRAAGDPETSGDEALAPPDEEIDTEVAVNVLSAAFKTGLLDEIAELQRGLEQIVSSVKVPPKEE